MLPKGADGVGVGLRGGGGGGLGDAGDETLDQLDRAFHGAARVAADVFVGREGDHEVEDALSGIAGSDGYGWGCAASKLGEKLKN